MLGAWGVVYGDIGTSPLYALKTRRQSCRVPSVAGAAHHRPQRRSPRLSA
ncbi:hypothetical protein DKT69_10995 [Micromonospora sicca]|uniref:K+ potassium transporter integral membrane domain-containing protein n=1 Tax=Micromonospora sicca TaxID=2202420 RepID=A0A317DKW9_9ACTN|nr:hypothetical protein DKT69_10995 [Micromonospora sp. 4G51]